MVILKGLVLGTVTARGLYALMLFSKFHSFKSQCHDSPLKLKTLTSTGISFKSKKAHSLSSHQNSVSCKTIHTHKFIISNFSLKKFKIIIIIIIISHLIIITSSSSSSSTSLSLANKCTYIPAVQPQNLSTTTIT